MAPAAFNPVLLKAEMGDAKLGQPVYYIYNTSTTFLVIAGDDRAEEILMVGDRPLKDINNLPPGMLDMLGIYKQEIMFLQEHPGLKVGPLPSPKNTPMLKAVTVGPLLTALWDQTEPYWNQCKFTYNNKTYQCLTGCPATSASMVMYYWKYPTSQVPAMSSYSSTMELSYYNSVNFTYPSLPATTFDWANMKDSYSGSYTTAQGNAVATLMRYVGQAEEMMYGTEAAGGSGIYVGENYKIADMFKHFGYKSTAQNVEKSDYSATDWASLIQSELIAGRPLVYCAVSSSAGGHAFNVDGYRDSDNKYHINWGWSGDGNTWCVMNSFSDGSYTFNQSQQAIIGVEPPSATSASLTVNPTSLNFTGCTTGQTYTKTFTVTAANLTGNVTISSSSTRFTVSPSTLTAAQAMAGATITVTYAPTAAGTQTGTITVASNGATSKTVSVSGTATAPAATLTVNPTSLSFSGSVGQTYTKTFTVTGVNLTGNVNLSSSNSRFTVSPSTLSAAQAMAGATITVTYSPTAAGTQSGTISVSSTGAASKTVSVSGTATALPTITVDPASVSLTTIVGTSVTQTINLQGVNLTSGVKLAVSGNYFTIDKTNIIKSAANNGATFTVTYYPTVTGTHTGTVTLTSTGAETVTIPLTGQANIVKYAPVMQPVNQNFVDLTKFRADWTDETPDDNVESYTLEVTAKSEPAPEPVLIGSLSGTSFTGSGYYAVTLTAPWAGVNVRGHNNEIVYFRNNYNNDGSYGNITYTVPAGYENGVFTVKITTGTSTEEALGNLTVATPQTAGVTQYFTPSQTHAWVVTASSGDKITITTPDAQFSPDIALIEIYSGDASGAKLMANETGDATYRLITGITNKFYAVENLAAEGTFLYKVKALYIDGTESEWSNVEEVTLSQNTSGVMGDVNHDGEFNIVDVTELTDYMLGIPNGIDLALADFNGDDDVTIADVTAMVDYLIGVTNAMTTINIVRPINSGK